MRSSLVRGVRVRRAVRRAVCRAVEPLEGRVLLSAVAWTGAGDGVNWTDPNNWSSHVLPGAGDDVTIAGGFAEVQLTSGAQTINSLTSASPFTLAGGTLSVATTFQASANVTLSGGTLRRATLTASGTAQLHATAGGLSGVTLASPMSVDESGSLHVSNGLTLSGGATLTLGNAVDNTFASLYFDGPGSQVLGGTGSILFAGDGTNGSTDNVYGPAFATLTIGPNITVHGNKGTLYTNATGTRLNEGTISADVSKGTITFANLGGITNAAGATLSALNGGTLTLAGTWSNAGTLTENNATLNLGGNITSSGLGVVRSAGGAVNLTGTLYNVGNTLALDASTGSWTLSGTINGGTITETGGAQLVAAYGRLSGVTLAGPMAVDKHGSLYVSNGLTLSGGATITLGDAADNTYGSLYFDGGSQTLGGTGGIVFAGNAYSQIYSNDVYSGNATTLTIGPNITVHGKNGYITDYTNYAGNASLLNQGTINADVAGGTIRLNGNGWANDGRLTATAGTLDLGGRITTAGLGAVSNAGGAIRISGTLDNTGNTLALSATTGSWTLTGTISGGTVTESGGAQLLPNAGRLTGVTLAGPMAIDENHALYVNDGLTLSGGATITLGNPSDDTFGELTFTDTSQTLGGTGSVVFSGNHISYFNNQTYDGGNNTTLTIGPNVTVRGKNGAFSNGYATSSLVNQGTLSADVAGGTINVSANAAFTNQGTMSAANGGTLNVTDTLVNLSAGTLTGGTWAAYANSTLGLPAAVTTNAANVLLSGPDARILVSGTSTSALATLSANAPSATLALAQAQGLSITPAGGTLTNDGTLDLGAGSALSVSGNFTQPSDGTLTVHLAGDGSFGSIASTGAAALGGAVQAILAGGYDPSGGTTFPVVSGATITNNSPTFAGGPTPSGRGLALRFNSTSALIAVQPLATTTTLTAYGPNPSNATQPLTFTATVSGGVPDGQTVELQDANHGNAVASGTLSNGSALLTIPAGTLSFGTHDLVAVYGGDADFAASRSAAYPQTVQIAVTAVVINGDNPNGLFSAAGQPAPGVQRSMVEDIVYTFSEPVTISDANIAFTVQVAGSMGTVPSRLYALAVPGSNGTQWAVSLTGQPVGGLGSIANGEYRIMINPSAVFAAADGTTTLGPGRTDTFYRLFGDINGDRSVNNADNRWIGRAHATYNPAFDSNADGIIDNADERQFRKDKAIDFLGDGFITSI